MTFNMKKENFRGIGNWNVAFAFLFLFSAAQSKADTKAWKPRILLLKEIPE